MKLVFLIFSDNPAYCRVVDTPPLGVTVDLGKMTWRCETWSKSDRPIGQSRYVKNLAGTIGVYNLEDMKHVSSMVNDAVEVQRRGGDCD